MPTNGKVVKISGPKPNNPKQLQNVPEHTKQPNKFLDEIRNETEIDQRLAILIQRSFYGFGHPEWFCLLRDTCRILRREHDQRFPTSDGSLAQSFQLVTDLKINELVGAILCRYGLVDLVSRRNGRRKSQRAPSSLLTYMLREVCPELRTAVESFSEFRKGLESLRQELKHGRHWFALSKRFGPGILALVPAHTTFGISNTR